MSMAILARIGSLETRVKTLEALLAKPIVEPEKEEFELSRTPKPKQMCPKCGLVPNYYFHVRNCKGKP